MKITLNGKETNIQNQKSIRELLQDLKIQPELVALELNQTIVRRKDFALTPIAEGDKIEILQMIGGG